MALKVGVGSVCQAGIQTLFGTPVAPTALLNMTSESVNVSVSRGDEGNLISSKTPNQRDMLAKNVEGGVSTILRPEFAEWLFQAVMGTKNGTVFTLAAPNSDLPVSTLVMSRGGIVKTYPDMSVRSLTLNAAAQDYVKADIDFVGIKELAVGDTGAQAVGALSFSKPSYRCTAATLKYGSAGAASPATSLDVESCSITIDNGLEDTPAVYSDGFYAGRPALGMRGVSVNFNIPYSDDLDAFRNAYYVADNAPALSLLLKFTTSDEDEYITILIPNLQLTDGSDPVGGKGYIDSSFTGEALSVGSTEPITVTVHHATVAVVSEG